MSYENQGTSTDHDRVISSGGWMALILGFGVMCSIEGHLVAWAAFLVTWLSVLPAAFFMARYKRSWYGWLDFAGMMLLCLVSGITRVTTHLMDQPFSATNFVYAGIMVFLWYWLIRMPRSQPSQDAASEVSHVMHHHVVYGQSPDYRAYPEPLTGGIPTAIPGRAMPALEPAKVRTSDSRQFLKRLVGNARRS